MYIRPPSRSSAAGTRQTAPGVVCGREDDAMFGGFNQEHVKSARHDRKFDITAFACSRG